MDFTHFEPNTELMEKLVDFLYDDGCGEPEEILALFESLRPDVSFAASSPFLRAISMMGNREVLFEFYRYCFSLPIFSHFERDSTMLRNLKSAGFEIEYQHHKPVDIIDKRKLSYI